MVVEASRSRGSGIRDHGKRFLTSVALLGALAACGDGVEPPRPTTIQVTNTVTTSPAGSTVTPAPTFVVLDQNGDVMVGLPVTVAVATGAGSLVGSPTMTGAEINSVGSWTLDQQAGINELEITVEGLTPVRIPVTGAAGPPATIVSTSTTPVTGQVATTLATGPSGTVKDQFGNPIAGVVVTIEFDGGTAPATVTTDAAGNFTVTQVVLGETSGDFSLTAEAGDALFTFTITAQPGPPASITVVSGGNQSTPAGNFLPQPLVLAVRDQFGNGVSGVTVTFEVIEGGGSLRSRTAVTGPDGRVTAPDWSVGLTIAPQRLRVTGASLSVDVNASIATDYDIDVRFYGPSVSASRQAIFSSAADRIRAVLIGDQPAVDTGTGIDLSQCGIDGEPTLTGTIDDLIIYATIRDIDGPNGVLGSAGPCFVRSDGGLPVLGVMQFDAADIVSLENNGTLRDIVMHEMLHVIGVGIGRYWNPFLTAKGTPNVVFTGPEAILGCQQSGGTTVCASSVRVENEGGAGTADSHFRESTFGSELMTGYAENGEMPLSRITIGSLADIGYEVNLIAADDYVVPVAVVQASPSANRTIDHVILPRFQIDRRGRVGNLDRASDPAFPNQ